MKFTLCKKQYIYLALAVISLALALTTRVFAQTPPEPAYDEVTPQTEVQEEVQQVAPEEQGGSALDTRVQDRIINLGRNVAGKLQAATLRMEQIIARLEARTVILRDKGANTEAAMVSLEKAKVSIGFAQSLLTDLDATLVNTITSESPREGFRVLKSRFLLIKESLGETHAALLETLSLLKVAVKEAGVETEIEQVEDTATSSSGSSN